MYGEGHPFGDPSWYQAYNTPYYNDSHKQFRKIMREYVDEHVMSNVHDWDAGASQSNIFCLACFVFWPKVQCFCCQYSASLETEDEKGVIPKEMYLGGICC